MAIALVPETDSMTKEDLVAKAVSLGYPAAAVRTYNMRVYAVPQDVYDALPDPKAAPAQEQRHKRPRRAKTHDQQPVLDTAPTSKEATDGE